MRSADATTGEAGANVNIVDLAPEYEEAWLHCLEPYSAEIRDGVERKRIWYERVRNRGLLVKLAVDDSGVAVGMVQALPIEQTWLEGEDLYFVLCIWVHGHDAGVGNQQGAGVGRALLEALEAEAQRRGARGIAAWGMALPLWMKASWFQKRGYLKVDRDGLAVLLWKPFTADAQVPHWPQTAPIQPELDPHGVTVTCFDAGWCSLQNGNCERARRAAAEAGVASQTVDTIDPSAAERWGQTYGIWLDGERQLTGPPISVERLRKRIDARVRGSWWRRLAKWFKRPGASPSSRG